MALFPSSPNTGDPFTSPDGARWEWDGQKWKAQGGGGAALTAANITVAPISNWSPVNLQQALADLYSQET